MRSAAWMSVGLTLLTFSGGASSALAQGATSAAAKITPADDPMLKRVFPSIQLNRSGTRREELLLPPEILQKTRILRQLMYNMDEIEAMELMLKNMKATKTNVEFFDMMRRGG